MNAVARRGIAVLLLGAILPFAVARAQVTSAAIEQAVFAGAVASPADFQQVLVVCNDTPVVANAGVALAPGCTVLPGATQVITTINRNEVEVTAEPGTQLDFLPDGIRVVLGQVFVKFRALDVRGWFRVETIHGIAEVRGTQFDVQVWPGCCLRPRPSTRSTTSCASSTVCLPRHTTAPGDEASSRYRSCTPLPIRSEGTVPPQLRACAAR
jgi:hypothetical protein